ncbi:hypothetical protein [Thalassotalea aquiviva]|uniref:hypothetical protein n=1 Tax=Thalassotalea aquiviva TaxID=3242415 RepID=UPI00352AD8C7
MRSHIFQLTVLLILTFNSALIFAQQSPDVEEYSKYVNITFEIHGLGQSVELLQQSSQSLAIAMKNLENNKSNFSSEDLKRIEIIASKMELMSKNIDQTVQDANGLIKNAKDPTVELVSSVIAETKRQAIDPIMTSMQTTALESVDNIKWALIWVGGVFCCILIIFTLIMVNTLNKLHKIMTIAQGAMQQGEFVFRLKEDPEQQKRS